MRLLMICTAGRSGVAGHHYSVRDLAAAFREQGIDTEIAVVVPGRDMESAALAGIRHHRVPVAGLGLQTAAAIRRLIASVKPTAVLCYDEFSSRLAILAAPFRRGLVVPVKPGWLNSDSWTNGVEKFVLFTRENLEFYRRNPRYRHVSLHYIPNRVIAPPRDPAARARLARAIPELDISSSIVLCPVRFDPNKSALIEAAISLHEELSRQRKTDLVVIGSSPHPDYLERLRADYRERPDIHFCSDPELTGALSSVFDAADSVIAMGRSAGEALLLGKAVYVPHGGSGKPVLVTRENFLSLQRFNFTERSLAHDDDDDEGGAPSEDDGMRDLASLVEMELSAAGAADRYRQMLAAPGRAVGLFRQLGTYLLSGIRVAAIVLRGRGRARQPGMRRGAAS